MWQHPQHHRLKVRHIPPGVLPPPPDVISPDQTFYFIRHGLTEMNEVLHEMEWGSPGFHDKGLWDTRLSSKGIQQAIDLHRKWRAQYDAEPSPQSHVIPWEKIDLVLSSPMLRTLQTFSLLNEYSPPPLIRRQVPRIAHPLLRERLYLSSDVGSPRSIIEPAFPDFDFSALPEDDTIWWYHPDCLDEASSTTQVIEESNAKQSEALDPEDKGDTTHGSHDTADNHRDTSNNNDNNDGVSQPYIEWRPAGDYLCAGEPADIFKERLTHLRHWLLSQSQSHIVVVAHWGVIRGLTGADVLNCEVRTVRAVDLLPEPFIDP